MGTIRKEEIEAVKRLGEIIGYGNMMHIASGLWAVNMLDNGYPESGVFIPTCISFLQPEEMGLATKELENIKKEIRNI